VATLAGAIAAAILGFVFAALVGRGLGPEAAGAAFAVISLAFILANVLELGADTGLLWRLPRLLSQGRSGDIPWSLWIAALPAAGAGALGAIGLWLTAPWWAARLGGGELVEPAVRAAALAVAVAPVTTVLIAGTRGLGALAPFVLLQNIALPAGRLVAMTVAAGSLTAFGVLAAWSVAYVPILVAAVVWLVVLVRRRTAGAPRSAQPAARLAGEFWAFSGPRAVTATVETLLVWLNVLLVGLLAGPYAAGLVGAASRFITTGTMAEQAIRVLVAPRFSTLLSEGRHAEASALYRRSSLWVLSLSWPLFLAMAAWAPLLLGVFGSGFTEATSVLVMLCISTAVAQTIGVAQTVLLMSGRSSAQLVNRSASLAALVVLQVALTPSLGAVGAALAWSIALLLDAGLALVRIRDVVAVSLDWRKLGYVGLAAAGCVLAPAWWAVRIAEMDWVSAGMVTLAGSLCYLGLLAARRRSLLADEHATTDKELVHD
jgi:O-antigen/teichoic acid export membrane protein